MTDRTPSIFKPIHAQFHAAQIMVCGTASVLTSQPDAPIQPPLTAPVPTMITRSYVITRPAHADPDSEKSSAQVETLVSPAVSPKSCELKLRKEGRQNPLTVRLSEVERGIIIQKARQAGCSVNGYIRAAALGSHYKPPTDPALARAVMALARELTAHGRNLNQIAHKRNADQITSQQADSMLDILGPAILRTLTVVRQTLTRNLEGPMP